MRRFAQTLESRGFHPQRKNNARGFLGIRIIPDEQPLYAWQRDA
jgi:hypothetical protein